MTERGVSIIESTRPTEPDDLFAALAVYRVYPKPLTAASIWARLNDPRVGAPGRVLDPRVLDGMDRRGIRPVVFVESNTPYADIRAGARDDALRAMGRTLAGRRAWLRWDHEMNGGTPDDPFFRWQAETPEDYRATARYVHDLVRTEAPDVSFVFSPAIRNGKRQSEYAAYFEPSAFEVVGFTAYQRDELRALSRQWRSSLAWFSANAPGLPVAVTECGRLKSLDRRLEYALDLHEVPGVDVVMAFDMDLSSPAHQWRFTARQRRAYMTGA